jgi:hypothetical protein
MATTAGKAARRRHGTKANAKRAYKRKPKNFGTSEAEKEEYRRLKAAKRKS